MTTFPPDELPDEQSCYDYLLEVLHPQGLHCPNGHPLPSGQAPHDRHRAPILDYRCRECGSVFNLFTDTMWSKTRYSCQTIVLILRGFAEGIPTQRLASELNLDRSHLVSRRHEIQALIDRGLPPFHRGRRKS